MNLEKHFEFTGETKVFCGITLKRIRASISFGMIAKGEVGGWVEKESNLSGDAWVSGNACVSGNAHVYGNACVSGDAHVFGDAQVSGNAHVSDNAWIYGNACVYGDAWEKSPLYINLTKWALTVSTKTTITIGCNSFTAQEWEEKADDIAKKEHMTENEIKEYKMAIQYAKNWMEIYCK